MLLSLFRFAVKRPRTPSRVEGDGNDERSSLPLPQASDVSPSISVLFSGCLLKVSFFGGTKEPSQKLPFGSLLFF